VRATVRVRVRPITVAQSLIAALYVTQRSVVLVELFTVRHTVSFDVEVRVWRVSVSEVMLLKRTTQKETHSKRLLDYNFIGI